jgi:CHAD domain-containing protein
LARAPRFDELTAATSLGEAARTILGALLEAVFVPVPAVLLGEDARSVHEMRVAIRRLRSGMTTFSDRFPRKRWRALRDATRRLGRRLGKVRDADVHLAVLRAARTSAAAEDCPGIDYALEAIGARRSRALADFAAEYAHFDRAAFAEEIARA